MMQNNNTLSGFHIRSKKGEVETGKRYKRINKLLERAPHPKKESERA